MIFEQIFVFIESQGPLMIFVILVLLAVIVIMLLEFLESVVGKRRN